jgi:uncharacterized membrane protein YebE (DUF533 family)
MTEPGADAEEEQHGRPPEFDESVVHVLGSKILLDWLRNRQQLLVPFTLDFGKLEKPAPETLIDGMAVSALADGADEETVQARVKTALCAARGSDEYESYAAKALASPKALHQVLGQIHDVRSGAVLYAACVLAVDRRKPANRHFLRYLASRLQLPEQLAKDIEQRFRSTL